MESHVIVAEEACLLVANNLRGATVGLLLDGWNQKVGRRRHRPTRREPTLEEKRLKGQWDEEREGKNICRKKRQHGGSRVQNQG